MTNIPLKLASINAAPNQRRSSETKGIAAAGAASFDSAISGTSRYGRARVARQESDGDAGFPEDYCVGKPDKTVCTKAGTCSTGKCNNGQCYSVDAPNGQSCDGGQCDNGECKPASTCEGVTDLTPCVPGTTDSSKCTNSLLIVQISVVFEF